MRHAQKSIAAEVGALFCVDPLGPRELPKTLLPDCRDDTHCTNREQMNEQTNKQMNEWMDGRTDRRTDRQTDRWTDRWMNT